MRRIADRRGAIQTAISANASKLAVVLGDLLAVAFIAKLTRFRVLLLDS